MASLDILGSLFGETIFYWLPCLALCFCIANGRSTTEKAICGGVLSLMLFLLFAGNLTMGKQMAVEMLMAGLGSLTGWNLGQAWHRRGAASARSPAPLDTVS